MLVNSKNDNIEASHLKAAYDLKHCIKREFVEKSCTAYEKKLQCVEKKLIA